MDADRSRPRVPRTPSAAIVAGLSAEESEIEFLAAVPESELEVADLLFVAGFYARRRGSAAATHRAAILRALAVRAPETYFHGLMSIAPQSEPELYRALADTWKANADKHPDKPEVLKNAAMFTMYGDGEWAYRLLRRAGRMVPGRSEFYELAADCLRGLRREILSPRAESRRLRIVALLFRAIEHAESPWAVAQYCCDAAQACYEASLSDAAECLAASALALGQMHSQHPLVGNVMHVAHTILGHLAVDREDWDGAVTQLLASIAVPETAQLRSYGALRSLASSIMVMRPTATEKFEALAAARGFVPAVGPNHGSP